MTGRRSGGQGTCDVTYPLPLANLWAMRSMVVYFAIMNIKIRFKGTFLGLAWAAIEPLLIFVILYLVFTSIQVTERQDFGMYLLTGIILFHIFSRGTANGMNSIRHYRNWILSLNIKKEFFPVLSTAATAVTTAVELGVFLGLMLLLQFSPPVTAVLLPAVVGLVLLLVLGLSYLLSILNVFVKDTQLVWGIFLQALFFMTPIFWYPQDIDNQILLGIHAINPLGQLVEIAHRLVVFGDVPPLADWAYPAAFTFVLFFAGYAIFRRYEGRIAEMI